MDVDQCVGGREKREELKKAIAKMKRLDEKLSSVMRVSVLRESGACSIMIIYIGTCVYIYIRTYVLMYTFACTYYICMHTLQVQTYVVLSHTYVCFV